MGYIYVKTAGDIKTPMAQVLNIRAPPTPSPTRVHHRSPSAGLNIRFAGAIATVNNPQVNRSWNSRHRRLKFKGRHHKQESTCKALENEFGGKETESNGGGGGGGGDSDGGSWSRWGGGSDGGDYWEEIRATLLIVLVILFFDLIFAYIVKGNQVFVDIFDFLSSIPSNILRVVFPNKQQEVVYADLDPKEREIGKRGRND